MAMDVDIVGGNTGNKVEADTNNNMKVNLPVVNSQAGFARLTYSPTSTIFKDATISDDGEIYIAPQYQLWDMQWNSASTTWAAKVGTVATTLTKAPTNGYMRLNSASATTTTTGIAVYSNRVFNIEEGIELRVRAYARHLNMAATNKQFDLGLGYYAFAAGQAAAMNEFIGFRWTTTGGLQCVVETSQGGAPTSQAVNINGNLPFSDNVTREYELVINESRVEFYVATVWVATINRDPASWSVVKGVSLPFIARGFNSGAASLGWNFDLGSISVFRRGGESVSVVTSCAANGKHSLNYQPDLIATASPTHVVPASGTAPTAAVGSNTASAFNATTAMGGYYRNTLTGVTVTTHTNILVAAYQNPALPTAAGVATNGRTFYCTGLIISPMVVTTALTGGGFTGAWFCAVGATATSLATTDADGTTAVAQKAPRFLPLSLMSTLAATAAAGVMSTEVGDHTINFSTPLPVHPGEFLQVGFRTIFVTAAVTAGAADGSIGVLGYWE
jgi:hypothetical protein